MLDTLDYSESLTDAGVPANQARAHAKALSEALESNNLATTEDIVRLEAKMTVMDAKFDVMDAKFDVMDSKFTEKLTAMESRFTVNMSEMKLELLKWGVGMVFALSGIMFALLRFMLP